MSGIGTTDSRNARPSAVAVQPSVIGVRTTPGPTALSGMCAPAHSGDAATRRSHRLSAFFVDA